MTSLSCDRDPLLSPDDAARIHAQALRILSKIGVEVRHPDAAAALHRDGFAWHGDRVVFEPAEVERYLEDARRLLGARPGRQHTPRPSRLTLRISTYALNVHDLESDRFVPYTAARLIEMTKFLDSLADERVEGAPPGIPVDVPPDLQPLAQYRIAALYARQGQMPVEPTSARTVNSILDMAEVMGHPVRRLPIYVPSPLRFGGDSLEVVLACADRLDSISVSSMPAAGATAPLQPFGALALSAAECLGGMIITRVLTGKPVTFAVNIFPFDLHTSAMTFGTPEGLLFELLSRDMNHYYGWDWSPAPDNLHVMAKRPDAQSAAEKAAILVLGASLGARYFTGAGMLSLDDAFSPEQLLLDCEMRDWAERAIADTALGETAVPDWIPEIEAGLRRGFIGLDSTLDGFREALWFPRTFRRDAIGPWMAEGQPHMSERLREQVRERISAHSFALDGDRRREIERIYASAARSIEQGSPQVAHRSVRGRQSTSEP